MNFDELTLLRTSTLGRVMTSQAISTYADRVIAFLTLWLVLFRTGSAWNVGTVAFGDASRFMRKLDHYSAIFSVLNYLGVDLRESLYAISYLIANQKG